MRPNANKFDSRMSTNEQLSIVDFSMINNLKSEEDQFTIIPVRLRCCSAIIVLNALASLVAM